MSNYSIVNGELVNTDELHHHGVKGMRWGVRKARRNYENYSNRRKAANESAKEWDEMAAYAKSQGKLKKAAKYSQHAKDDRADARVYDERAKAGKQRLDEIAKKSNVGKEVVKGALREAGIMAANDLVNKFADRLPDTAKHVTKVISNGTAVGLGIANIVSTVRNAKAVGQARKRIYG